MPSDSTSNELAGTQESSQVPDSEKATSHSTTPQVPQSETPFSGFGSLKINFGNKLLVHSETQPASAKISFNFQNPFVKQDTEEETKQKDRSLSPFSKGFQPLNSLNDQKKFIVNKDLNSNTLIRNPFLMQSTKTTDLSAYSDSNKSAD